MKILIVEDNRDILENICAYLESQAHVVDVAADGNTAMHLLGKETYDVIVLDILLPGVNGIEICRRLREDLHNATPVIMLTARDKVDDRVQGLDVGADDYLVKPFSLVELDARIRAQYRRSRVNEQWGLLQVGELICDVAQHRVTHRSMEITLSPIGFRILQTLMQASPNVVPREQLERDIWGDNVPDSDALKVHIHALRDAIDKPFGTNFLYTVRGIGFKMVNFDAS
ncbi:MAG: response regulator transcription factor [Gammaproteobacteria bacterium]|nr:response regulator transcription factor [Gammaproteobacteria bacterium]